MIKKTRLLSLDVMRGITIAGMILVNNPGSWSYVYAPLGHAEWNGLTPTDLVFPFFMFIMGVSMDFSLHKFGNKLNGAALKKILKRTVIIFAIGLAIAWFSGMCSSIFNIGNTDMTFGEKLTKNLFPINSIRLLGVMQRLALAYCGGALLSFLIPKRMSLGTAFTILIFYAILLLVGNGFDFTEDNIVAVVDRKVLGINHMYKMPNLEGVRIPFDPEGLLSTIPCFAHVMLGMYVGRIIMKYSDNMERISRIFVFGTALLFAGCLLSYGIPVNKKIWSPTYVLVTCGLGSLLLSLLIWMIDMRHKTKWCRFFDSFGINPLFMYVLGAVLAILIGNIRFQYYGDIVTLKGFIFHQLLQPAFGNYPASAIYAILFVCLNWIFGYQLYKRKIYIKI